MLTSFDLSTLSHITDGYTSGHMDMVVHSMLTKRRLERIKAVPIDLPEIIQWLCRVRCITCMMCCAVMSCHVVTVLFSLTVVLHLPQVNPMSKEEDEQIRKWMDKTLSLKHI